MSSILGFGVGDKAYTQEAVIDTIYATDYFGEQMHGTKAAIEKHIEFDEGLNLKGSSLSYQCIIFHVNDGEINYDITAYESKQLRS